MEKYYPEACGRLAGRSDRVACSCSILRSVASACTADHRADSAGDFSDAGEGLESRVACLLYDILPPMTPEIIRKLNEFLVTHDPVKEECEAVYLMVELRKLLEREYKVGNHWTGKFAKVRFYCDWTVHPSKDQNQPHIKDIMEKLNEKLSKGEDTSYFFSLSELRNEMSEVFRTQELQDKLCRDDECWKRFVDVLIPVLTEQPITNPITGIASISFVAGITKTVEVKFTNGRKPHTFTVGS